MTSQIEAGGVADRPVVPSVALGGTLLLVVAAIVVLFAADTFLAKLERSESRGEAARLHAEGERLAGLGRTQEALERFRAAVYLVRNSETYRVSLADALLAAGQPDQAKAVLADVLQAEPASGPANLTMARVLQRQGRLQTAVFHYHQAIHGRWSEDAPAHAVSTRFELVELLARVDARRELLSELLPLQDEAPGDLVTRERIGRLFIQAGSPARAANVFRDILRRHPGEAAAHAGLAEAEFASGNYRSAHRSFTTAARLSAGDSAIRTRLEATEQILALDPTRRGLPAAEQSRRSVMLVRLTLDSLSRCAGADAPSALLALADTARRLLARPVRAPWQDDVFERRLTLADRLWHARLGVCRGATDEDQPIALVLAKLAR